MSTHEPIHSHSTVAVGSNRNFGLVFAGVFALLAFWPLIRSGAEPRWWCAAVSVAFLGVALTRPDLLAPLNRLWMQFGLLLQKVVSPVIMAVMFFGVVTPTAFILRLLGKDLLRLNKKAQASYWIERNPPGPKSETMNRQF